MIGGLHTGLLEETELQGHTCRVKVGSDGSWSGRARAGLWRLLLLPPLPWLRMLGSRLLCVRLWPLRAWNPPCCLHMPTNLMSAIVPIWKTTALCIGRVDRPQKA